jgi:hypothetical protein
MIVSWKETPNAAIQRPGHTCASGKSSMGRHTDSRSLERLVDCGFDSKEHVPSDSRDA